MIPVESVNGSGQRADRDASNSENNDTNECQVSANKDLNLRIVVQESRESVIVPWETNNS